MELREIEYKVTQTVIVEPGYPSCSLAHSIHYSELLARLAHLKEIKLPQLHLHEGCRAAS